MCFIEHQNNEQHTNSPSFGITFTTTTTHKGKKYEQPSQKVEARTRTRLLVTVTIKQTNKQASKLSQPMIPPTTSDEMNSMMIDCNSSSSTSTSTHNHNQLVSSLVGRSVSCVDRHHHHHHHHNDRSISHIERFEDTSNNHNYSGWKMMPRRTIDDAESRDMKANAGWDDVSFVQKQQQQQRQQRQNGHNYNHNEQIVSSSLLRRVPHSTNNCTGPYSSTSTSFSTLTASNNPHPQHHHFYQQQHKTDTASTAGAGPTTSSKLRQLLKDDLRLSHHDHHSTEDSHCDTGTHHRNHDQHRTTTTTAHTPAPTPAGSTYTSPTTGVRRLLKDQHVADIQRLLRSLQSTEFVGTVDPRYHSQYFGGGVGSLE